MAHLSHILRSRSTAFMALAAATGASVALAATLVTASPASALPPPQAECTMGAITLTPSSTYVPLTPDALTFTESVNDQTTVAMAAADISVSPGAEVRIAWSANHEAPVEGKFGPANFSDHQEFAENHMIMAMFGLGTGTHTMQAYVRLSGPSGATATLLHRCAFVEGPAT